MLGSIDATPSKAHDDAAATAVVRPVSDSPYALPSYSSPQVVLSKHPTNQVPNSPLQVTISHQNMWQAYFSDNLPLHPTPRCTSNSQRYTQSEVLCRNSAQGMECTPERALILPQMLTTPSTAKLRPSYLMPPFSHGYQRSTGNQPIIG